MSTSSGSSTGNPRNKVALKPGHSLMDWIRLGNSGLDLSGTGGAFLDVTPNQLSQHNSVDDSWLSIRGKVYNITKYLDFHPGGVDELMKGAGKDATSLFNKVHPWVNFESILSKCVVGRLRYSVEDNIEFSITDSSAAQSLSKENSNQRKTSGKSISSKVDWYQQLSYITYVFYLHQPAPKVTVDNILERELWVKVGSGDEWVGWEVPGELIWPPQMSMNDTKLELKFSKSKPQLWSNLKRLDSSVRISNYEDVKLSVTSISQITHNVFIVVLNHTNKFFTYIPIGHHLVLKGCIKGITVERPYTPVCRFQEENICQVVLMVKAYPDGLFSSWLTKRKLGELLEVSEPQGTFSISQLSSVDNLVLLAAGTGITPMIRIIYWSRSRLRLKILLVFFNKTEQDIIWRDEFHNLAENNNRFSVEHILSEASASWSGKRGWVTPQLLQSFLPEKDVNFPLSHYVCVCGPISFTQLTERYLQDMGYTNQNYFCFRG